MGIFQRVLLARKRGRSGRGPRTRTGSIRPFTWLATRTSGLLEGRRSSPTTSTSRKKIRRTKRARAGSRPRRADEEEGSGTARIVASREAVASLLLSSTPVGNPARSTGGNTMEFDSLQKLYVDELKDLHSAERQIIQALPKMIKAASSPELKSALQEHLD